MRIVNIQLREQAEADIKNKVATMPIDAIPSDKEPIIEELTTRLRGVAESREGEASSELGLKIVTVQIKEAVVSSTRLWENLQKLSRARREQLARSEVHSKSQSVARMPETAQAMAKPDEFRASGSTATALPALRGCWRICCTRWRDWRTRRAARRELDRSAVLTFRLHPAEFLQRARWVALGRGSELIRDAWFLILSRFSLWTSGNPRRSIFAAHADCRRENIRGRAVKVMGLFATGEGQGYTEADICEPARAFNDWITSRAVRVTDKPEFIDDPKLHDDGVKAVLGKEGIFTGTDAIALLLEQPATPRSLTRKL